MSTVDVPDAFGAEDLAWQLLLDLADAQLPRWVLAGGLMVHLHLLQHGRTPRRATTDVDAIVDIAVHAERATEVFADRLVNALGMDLQLAGDGVRGHRFMRSDGAVVDVLAPDGFSREGPPQTIPPAVTVEVPGGRMLIGAAEQVAVAYRGRRAVLLRPTLLASIIGKWRGFVEIPVQRDPDRHLRDAADLLTVLVPDDVQVTGPQRRYLQGLAAELERHPGLAGDAGKANLALDALSLLLRQ